MPRTGEDKYSITVEGAGAFTELNDVPASYTGSSGKVATVNATEDGLEFTTVSGGGGGVVSGEYNPQYSIISTTEILDITNPSEIKYERSDDMTTITGEMWIDFGTIASDGTKFFRMEIPDASDNFNANDDVEGLFIVVARDEASTSTVSGSTTTLINGKMSLSFSFPVKSVWDSVSNVKFYLQAKIYRGNVI